MTLHVLSFPQIFLVKVTTWSLDYNTSSEATIAAGFIKISHLKKNKKTKGKEKRNKFTFLYSICIDIYIHIYLYIGGVEYCRIILHVLIKKT